MMQKHKLRKAVFPVAGMGTRFLPATKASPKEMMPIVDKPLIQYAVEEAIAAGFTDMIFVTGRGKRAIEDHFDRAVELEATLAKRAETELLSMVRNIVPRHVTCSYVRQPEALGLGHAVLCARTLIGDEPFAVVLADDLINARRPVLRQLLDIRNTRECSVIAVEKVPRSATQQYGMVRARKITPGLHNVSAIIEKPAPAAAPSRLGVVGRYLLSPQIFTHLQLLRGGKGGEIQLTDGIAGLLAEEEVLALEFNGTRYDCGSKLGYMKANIDYGCRHPEIGDKLHKYLIKKEFLSTPK